ncbi:hypothetical protein AVEN_222376-1 [Araneus ventricosus]|uniref:Uncharacterized protein n=1 Tax=Araneus ventricosus TaxID=182803 RepID=A0A4Y2EGB8_ARAVE|nr:hypothetical protein AVEN_222376-1 [Araneus ventricosus]
MDSEQLKKKYKWAPIIGVGCLSRGISEKLAHVRIFLGGKVGKIPSDNQTTTSNSLLSGTFTAVPLCGFWNMGRKNLSSMGETDENSYVRIFLGGKFHQATIPQRVIHC